MERGMYARETDPFGMWQGHAKEAFEFWVSLWPVAPLFGVEWRFAEMMRQFMPAMQFGISSSRFEQRGASAEPSDSEAEKSVIDITAEDAVEVKVAATPAKTAPARDDLTRIKGIGPALAKELNALGITSLAQIAGLSEAHVAALDTGLSGVKGRCTRDDWVGQAKALTG
jgi:NADH-quinone oxidoreductase subunit E